MSAKVRDDINAAGLEYARNRLRGALGKCTEKQRAFFDCLYPKGPNQDQIANAIDLCERTIRKNKNDGGNLA